MGSDLYFASGSGLSAVTQDEPKLECLSLDEVIRGGFRMPVLDIVITQYLDSSYQGRLGQRPGTVSEYGTCWALM